MAQPLAQREGFALRATHGTALSSTLLNFTLAYIVFCSQSPDFVPHSN